VSTLHPRQATKGSGVVMRGTPVSCYNAFMWPWQLRKLGLSCGEAMPSCGRDRPKLLTSKGTKDPLTLHSAAVVAKNLDDSRKELQRFHHRTVRRPSTVLDSLLFDAQIRRCEQYGLNGNRKV